MAISMNWLAWLKSPRMILTDVIADARCWPEDVVPENWNSGAQWIALNILRVVLQGFQKALDRNNRDFFYWEHSSKAKWELYSIYLTLHQWSWSFVEVGFVTLKPTNGAAVLATHAATNRIQILRTHQRNCALASHLDFISRVYRINP